MAYTYGRPTPSALPQTLGEIIKEGSKMMARCNHCDNERAVGLRMLVERYGADWRPGEHIEMLRRSMHCSSCGLKGARIEFTIPAQPSDHGPPYNTHSHDPDDGWRAQLPPDDPWTLKPHDLRLSRAEYMRRFRAIAARLVEAWKSDHRRAGDIEMITRKGLTAVEMTEILKAHPDWFRNDAPEA